MHRREQSEIQEKEIDKQDYVQVAASKPSSSVFRSEKRKKNWSRGNNRHLLFFFLSIDVANFAMVSQS